MKINFPADGQIILGKTTERPQHFVTAPLRGSFAVDMSKARLGQPYVLTDDEGTALTYRLATLQQSYNYTVYGTGDLVGVEYAVDTITVAEHKAKVDNAIEVSFQAGREFQHGVDIEAQAAADADLLTHLGAPSTVYVTYDNGTMRAFFDITEIGDLGEELSLGTADGSFIGIHPLWRSYEVVDPAADEIEDAGVESAEQPVSASMSISDIDPQHLTDAFGIQPEQPTKGIDGNCECGACVSAATGETAAYPTTANNMFSFSEPSPFILLSPAQIEALKAA